MMLNMLITLLSAIKVPSHPHYISKYASYDRISACHKAFSVAITSHTEPQTFSQAIKCLQWQTAMQTELKVLSNNTLTLIHLHPGKTPTRCRRVYKIK